MSRNRRLASRRLFSFVRAAMRRWNFEGQATPWPARNIETTSSPVPVATRGSFAREKRNFQRLPPSARALPPRSTLPSSARIRDGAAWTWRKVRHAVNAAQITSFRYLLRENARNRSCGVAVHRSRWTMKTILLSVLGLTIRIAMAHRTARFVYAAWRKR